jgi:hypothetical protein
VSAWPACLYNQSHAAPILGESALRSNLINGTCSDSDFSSQSHAAADSLVRVGLTPMPSSARSRMAFAPKEIGASPSPSRSPALPVLPPRSALPASPAPALPPLSCGCHPFLHPSSSPSFAAPFFSLLSANPCLLTLGQVCGLMQLQTQLGSLILLLHPAFLGSGIRLHHQRTCLFRT